MSKKQRESSMTCEEFWFILIRSFPRVSSLLYHIFCFSRVTHWDIQNRMQELTFGFITEFGDLWNHGITWKTKFLYDLEWNNEIKSAYHHK